MDNETLVSEANVEMPWKCTYVSTHALGPTKTCVRSEFITKCISECVS